MAIKFEPPCFEVREFKPKTTRYCVVVPTLNDGDRIDQQLYRMRANADLADIVLADGRSTDGSIEPSFLGECRVRALLVTDELGLGTTLRMGLVYAMEQGYEGVITVDGNGKDDVARILDFIAALDAGYDFVQGSRFMEGGHHENTPISRYLGIRLVVSPIIAVAARYWYTDPTNGFKALSMSYLKDKRLQPIRDVFAHFGLQFYLNTRAPRLGCRLKEIPVTRVYPHGVPIPTKITRSQAVRLLYELICTAVGRYNP